MQNTQSIVDLLRRNTHRRSPIISSAYGANLDSRMFNRILYASVITTIYYIILVLNRYNNQLLPVFIKFLLIPNRINNNLIIFYHHCNSCLASRINKFMDLKVKCSTTCFNPLNPELNPICYLLALLGVQHFRHVSRIRVKLLTVRLLMSYIYMEHPFLMFLGHTQRRSTVSRTPLDE